MAAVKTRARAAKAKRGGAPASKPTAPVPGSVPPALSFVAGYVDSCLFIALFGLFVAQATGSFVLAGSQIAGHSHEAVKILAIPIFLLGATVTTIMGLQLRGQGRPALAWCLLLEALLLTGILVSGLLGAPFTDPGAGWSLAVGFFALAAMGVQSALVRLMMQGVASTNVMTTNTTLIGIDLAEFLLAWRAKRRAQKDRLAARRYNAVRRRFAAILLITLGFLFGATFGAVIFSIVGWPSLVVPIAIVAALAGWATIHER